MSSLKPSHHQPRLLKLASVTLVGLMSGLLSGCTSDSISSIALLLPNHHNTEWQGYSIAAPDPLPGDHLSSHANFSTSRHYLEMPSHLRLRTTQRLTPHHP